VADALNERKFTSQQWSQEDIVQKLSRLKCTLKTPKSAQKSRFQPTESHDSPTIPRPEPPAPSSSSSSQLETYLLSYQQHLLCNSKLGSLLFDHPSDRGTSHEQYLKLFLSKHLPQGRIGIGSGEILLPFSASSSSAGRRQRDIVIYDPNLPLLSNTSGISLFFEQSVMAVVEVKTTLTNQVWKEVGEAAAELSVPVYMFAFHTSISLETTHVASLPTNLRGIFSLESGTLLRRRSNDDWMVIHAHHASSLTLFWLMLLKDIREYDEATGAGGAHLDWSAYVPPSYHRIISQTRSVATEVPHQPPPASPLPAVTAGVPEQAPPSSSPTGVNVDSDGEVPFLDSSSEEDEPGGESFVTTRNAVAITQLLDQLEL